MGFGMAACAFRAASSGGRKLALKAQMPTRSPKECGQSEVVNVGVPLASGAEGIAETPWHGC